MIPGQPTEIYRAHARQALFPARGVGIRERAEAAAELTRLVDFGFGSCAGFSESPVIPRRPF